MVPREYIYSVTSIKMKRTVFILALMLYGCLNAFSQATSLTVNCQTPGWLSSMINYGDQQTLENIKVTGYINGTDIQFLYDLNGRSLTGVIDLEDASMVKGGTPTISNDNEMPKFLFNNQTKPIQKFIYPKTLVNIPILPKFTAGVDSIIWTSTIVKDVNLSYISGLGRVKYIYIPEGIERVTQMPIGIHVVFPGSLTDAGNYGLNSIIYSFIQEPEKVKAIYEYYYSDGINSHSSYYSAYRDCIFYIPKGTLNKYLNSDFANKNAWDHKEQKSVPNGNIFVEFFDVDSTVVNSPIDMYVGDTIKLDVTIYPNDSLVNWVDYVSNDPEIICINSDRTITAKKYGQADVYVTPHVFIDGLETKTGTCKINVLAHVEGIELPNKLTVHIDEEKALNAFTLPLGITDNKIIYECSDLSVAEVTEDGIVKGLKRGTCTITATSVDGGYKAECNVTVILGVEAITMEKHSLSLKVGETEKLFANVYPSNADDKSIQWLSTNEDISIVDENGNVKALKGGNCWIKAISIDNNEATDSCYVTVEQPVTGIELDANNLELGKIGEMKQLHATVLPEDASNKGVKWFSTNTNVCTVSSSGIVVAVGFGSSVITATTEDGGFVAVCMVNVVDRLALYDLNGDGKISTADIQIIINEMKRPQTEQDMKYDLNNDGKISTADIQVIINEMKK